MFGKLEQFLFYFLFFAIPLQTRKILYSPGWYHNEWQSISIYATDIILLILFIFWAVDKRHRKSFIHRRPSFARVPLHARYDWFLLAFLTVAAISVKNSSDIFVGLFLWLKLVEFALLYFYLKTYAIHKFNFTGAFHSLIIGGVFQAIIAVGQFLKQGDLGLRWLGESVLNSNLSGIASFFTDSGEKIIRAYGTTPHPNILGAYLFLSVFAFYLIYIYRIENKSSSIVLKFWWIWYPLMLLGFFFTFSRVVIFLWFAGFLIRSGLILCKSSFRQLFLYKHENRIKLVKVVLFGIFVIIFSLIFYWPEVSSRITLSSQEEAVRLRLFYNEELLSGSINFFGIGLGNFTGWLMEKHPNLPMYMYQPVHNIYLLIYSEIGIIGLIFFLLFLAGLFYEFIKKTKLLELKHYSSLLIILSILFMGLFDHFLFTMQQGRFILWLCLALLIILVKHDNITSD